MGLSDDKTVAPVVLPSLLDFPSSLGDDILPTHSGLVSERVSKPRLFRCLEIPFAMVPWASQLSHVHVPTIEELWCGCDPANFFFPYHEMPTMDLDTTVGAGLKAAGISFSSQGLRRGGKSVIASCFCLEPHDPDFGWQGWNRASAVS